eukprot:scpid69413/ scgid17074/ Pre-mRNA-splicing factor cwc2
MESEWQADEHGNWYMQRGQWVARVDPASQAVYYQDTRTQKTQWDAPYEWSCAQPVAGKVVVAPKKLPARCLDFSHRQARCQVDPEEAKKTHFRPEGAGEFNIWYGRYVGEMWNEHHNEGPSPYRCDARKDSGFTKATLEGSGARFFCVFFAKGCCHLGPECGYLHRVPRDEDARHIDQAHDVFGRDRHRQHNTTMSGVGSIEKDCKTLYAGNLHCRRTGTEDELKEEFGEWGEIERMNIIRTRNIAFMTYKNRINAEFAKVAMSSQQLGGHTLMNVRWAYDDPNPRAQLKRLHESQEQMLSVLKDRSEYGPEVPAAKRLVPATAGSVTGPYPDTSQQYAEDEEVDKVLMREQGVMQQASDDCGRLDGIFRRLEENNRNDSTASAVHDTNSSTTNSYIIKKVDALVSSGADTVASTSSSSVAAKETHSRAERPKAKHSGIEMTVSSSHTTVATAHKVDPTKDPFRVVIPK